MTPFGIEAKPKEEVEEALRAMGLPYLADALWFVDSEVLAAAYNEASENEDLAKWLLLSYKKHLDGETEAGLFGIGPMDKETVVAELEHRDMPSLSQLVDTADEQVFRDLIDEYEEKLADDPEFQGQVAWWLSCLAAAW